MVIKNRIIFSYLMGENKLNVNYLGIAARGDIDSPWNLFDSGKLRVIDLDQIPLKLIDCISWLGILPLCTLGVDKRKHFTIAIGGATSSMYRPNDYLGSRYNKKRYVGRVLKKRLRLIV